MTDQPETFYGLGRRKTAIAKVWLIKHGSRTVNGLPLEEYFTIKTWQEKVLAPLKLTAQDDYGIKAVVKGGGKSAQAEAVRLGLSRSLLTIDPAWRKQLKEAGFVTRDPRAKERKKYGLKRARRAPQFSKR